MTESARPRRKLGIRWWHKWVGIGIGVLLFIWVGSGVVMLLPGAESRRVTPPAVDWATVTVTPARAAEVGCTGAAGAAVKGIELRRVQSRVVYAVECERARVMVDATSGEPWAITADVARQLAREAYPSDSIISVERLTRRPKGYFASTPVYRVRIADARDTWFYVAEPTGEIARSMKRNRQQTAWGHDLHTLTFLRVLPGREQTRIVLFVVTSVIAIVSILTGYWLGLPKRWRGPA